LASPITSVFSKRLKQARDLRGLSQRALGGMVSEDKNRGAVRINRYEREVHRADMDSAAELAKTLDVPLAFFFAEEDDLAEAILAFSKLPNEERARLLGEMKRAGQTEPE